MSIVVRPLVGADVATAIDDLARLRMTVFASWPYLYDGDPQYEARYLREFASARDAVIVAAYDGERIVGVSTASPMTVQDAQFRAPLERHGLDASELFYFGESVLLETYRGKGVGHAFFDQREAHARMHGAKATVFAAVARSETQPPKPADHVSLEAFWRRRGYEPLVGATASMDWQELGAAGETPHAMQFWFHSL